LAGGKIQEQSGDKLVFLNLRVRGAKGQCRRMVQRCGLCGKEASFGTISVMATSAVKSHRAAHVDRYALADVHRASDEPASTITGYLHESNHYRFSGLPADAGYLCYCG
jgi:hypothetical protein